VQDGGEERAAEAKVASIFHRTRILATIAQRDPDSSGMLQGTTACALTRRGQRGSIGLTT
jgi:hypothetical protein